MTRPSEIDGPAAAAIAPLAFDVVTDLASIEAVWRALEACGPTSPFQRFDWVATWVAAQGGAQAAGLAVVRGRRGAVTEWLWPLSVGRSGGVRVARWLGGSHASYDFGVWRTPQSAAIDAATLRAGLIAVGQTLRVDAFALVDMPVVWDGVATPFTALPHRPSVNDGHCFRLPVGFDALLAARNAGHKRKKVRSKEKILAAAGDYAITTAATPEAVEAALSAYFAQKAAALAARGIADPFAAPAVRDFYRRLAIRSLGSSEPLLELTTLAAGGAIRAVIGASLFRGRLLALFASFAQDELTRASPGETLFFRHIEATCGRGLSVYDMGVGSERYKTSWCDETVALIDVHLAVTPIGHLHGGLIAARDRLKTAIRRNARIWGVVKRLRARLAGKVAAVGADGDDG